MSYHSKDIISNVVNDSEKTAFFKDEIDELNNGDMEESEIDHLPRFAFEDNDIIEVFDGELDDKLISAIEGVRRYKENGDTLFFDDLGVDYRINNRLIPCLKCEVNGYCYCTDEKGRTAIVAGFLHMKEYDKRKYIRDSMDVIGKGDQKNSDDRGHIIADQFGGDNGLINLVPQDSYVNRNEYKELELKLAKFIKEDKEVFAWVDIVYDANSERPKGIIFTYIIDGEKKVESFAN